MQVLTYSYNTHVNRAAWTTPFRLVLSIHPPVPASFDHASAFLIDVNNAREPAMLGSNLLPRIYMMQQRTDKKLIVAQRRHWDHHVRCIRTTAPFRLGQLVYVDCPPLSVADDDRMAIDSKWNCCRASWAHTALCH